MEQAPPSASQERGPSRKPDPVALELQRKLRWLLAHRTSAVGLEDFLSHLNSVIVTALIAQALKRVEAEQAPGNPA